MRNTVIGLIVGIVAGIVLGTTVIAPRLAQNVKREIGLTATPAAEEVSEPSETATDKTAAPAPEFLPGALEPAQKINPILRLRMASAYPGSLAAHGTSARRLSEILWRVSDGRFDLKFHPRAHLSMKRMPLTV